MRRSKALETPVPMKALGGSEVEVIDDRSNGRRRVEAESDGGDDHAGLARIREAQAEVKERLLRYLAAKEEAKLLKDAHDAAVDHLMSVIDRETEILPLFEANR